MARCRAAFTLIELVATVAIVGVLLAVLFPMAARARNASGLTESIQNVALQLAAAHRYQADNAGRAPMRACGYSNGQVIGGWDTWNYGGKNCNVYWNNYIGGIFDEPAYARPLNAYVGATRMHVPLGYVSTPTMFAHGHPTQADRDTVQIPLFRSPGDVASHQQVWPAASPGISAYNDIGTSYTLNMKWWDDPTLASLSFSARYLEGVRRIGLALGGANPNFLWIHDQTGELAANNIQIKGEFGTFNASVVGWADGRADYIVIVPGAFSGPGYTFLP